MFYVIVFPFILKVYMYLSLGVLVSNWIQGLHNDMKMIFLKGLFLASSTGGANEIFFLPPQLFWKMARQNFFSNIPLHAILVLFFCGSYSWLPSFCLFRLPRNLSDSHSARNSQCLKLLQAASFLTHKTAFHMTMCHL